MSRIRSILGLNTKSSFSNLSAEIRRKNYLSEADFEYQDYEIVSTNAAGSATYTINKVHHARYIAIGKMVNLQCSLVGTTSGAAGFYIRLTLPFTGYTPNINGPVGALISDSQVGPCSLLDGAERKGYYRIGYGSNFIEVYKHDVTNYGIGANKLVQLSLTYERI